MSYALISCIGFRLIRQLDWIHNNKTFLIDMSDFESKNDANGYPNGGLSAGWSSSKFLQEYNFLSSSGGKWCRFSFKWNGPFRSRSINEKMYRAHVIFLYANHLFPSNNHTYTVQIFVSIVIILKLQPILSTEEHIIKLSRKREVIDFELANI